MSIPQPNQNWRHPAQKLWIVLYIAFVLAMLSILVIAFVPGLRTPTSEWTMRGIVGCIMVTAFFTGVWERRFQRRLAQLGYLLCPRCRYDLSTFQDREIMQLPCLRLQCLPRSRPAVLARLGIQVANIRVRLALSSSL